MSLQEIREKIDQLKGKRDDIQSRIAENKVEIRLAKDERDNILKCNRLLSYISEHNQDKIIKLFEHTISSGLKDLFDESYGFKFELTTRGNSSACDFSIQCSDYVGWTPIVMCHGRSIQEIVGIIFRLILIKLDKRNRKILILDEPAGGVEKERQPLLSKFLKEICEKFEVQLIVVTQDMELCEWADAKVNLNGDL